MRKNDPWKDDPWWDPSCGAGVLSDDDTENRIRQLDRTPEWREDEEKPAAPEPTTPTVPSTNGQPGCERIDCEPTPAGVAGELPYPDSGSVSR